MPFHNPYHFVPVKSDARPDDLSLSNFEMANVGQVTHAQFVSHTSQGGQIQSVYSGRLICRFTTEDPIVIGARREQLQDGSHRVDPFQLNGDPAIPASTLRGLISSIAEAASNSTLRILEDRPFSYRASLPKSLSAIGMIVEVQSEGEKKFRLRPLALPTMQGPRGGAMPLENPYRKIFPKNRTPPLKVYVGDYNSIRSTSFVKGLPFQSFSRDRPQYCYAKLYPRQWTNAHTLPFDRYQYRKSGGRDREFLLSQITTDGHPPQMKSELPDNEEEGKLYTRGILRILGVPDRRDIPHTKKHELFIPYPEDVEDIPTVPILPEALERFYRLADERTEASKEETLPYEPRGTVRNTAPESADDRRFRLKDGDLVYFRPDDRGEAVEEIALSAVWRKWARTSYDYFRQISPETLPFHRNRQQVTIAEQLFGFVEQRQDRQSNAPSTHALASRLRFSFGLLHPDQNSCFEGEVLLKVLDSPKPPSPALYFKRRDGEGEYISKSALKPELHTPQGRKFYLHRQGSADTPWQTLDQENNLKQKSWVCPLKSGLIFYFHIDFENLSHRELGLLCYALRPTESFRHKIGMGKSVGLGKIRIDPVGLFYVDRRLRYQETSLFEATRYHESWTPAEEAVSEWPGCYEREKREATIGVTKFPTFDAVRQFFVSGMDPDIRQALALLGDPSKVQHPVHTPLTADVSRLEMESETYRWFVANDIGSGRGGDRIRPQEKFLEPLDRSSTKLPTLPEHPWKG